MFVREKKNKSGKVSVQIIDKSNGSYKVLKTIGCTNDSNKLAALHKRAEAEIQKLSGQLELEFHSFQEADLIATFYRGIKDLQLTGPELLFNGLYHEIGFSSIREEIFRQLVFSRLEHPVSKLRTVEYLQGARGVDIDVAQVYRYMDKHHARYIDQVKEIAYNHAKKIMPSASSVVFYDVTTIYFESEQEDDLRKTGFSKEGRHRQPQILLGLLIDAAGFPLAYEIFEGNKFEGHTMLPILERFKAKYGLSNLVVVADSGLLSNKNITELEEKQYEYIVGARIKNCERRLRTKILDKKLTDGKCAVISLGSGRKMVVGFSDKRAKKDAYNRKRGLQRLEKAITAGKLSKKHLINRGYNKYLKLSGQATVSIDLDTFNDDAKWDGLKGYLTNTSLSKNEVIVQYQQLWLIEKAFRISKTDLRIRPIFHYIRKRIESHISISFAALTLYKELERQLRRHNSDFSAEKAIETAKTIFSLTILSPLTKKKYCRLLIKTENQARLLELFNIDVDLCG